MVTLNICLGLGVGGFIKNPTTPSSGIYNGGGRGSFRGDLFRGGQGGFNKNKGLLIGSGGYAVSQSLYPEPASNSDEHGSRGNGNEPRRGSGIDSTAARSK